MTQVKYSARCALLLIFFTLAPYSYAGIDKSKPIPSPEIVQARVWQNMVFQDFLMSGFIKIKDKFHPILLRTKERTMIYEFQKIPLHIKVTFTPQGSHIMTRAKTGDPWHLLSFEERKKIILDSDIAYEDLGLDFIRWHNVKPLGADSILTLPAWAYESRPSIPSRYAKAHYWISSDHLALLRVDAFNAKDQVVKKVEILGVMEVNGYFMPKELRIATMIPGRNLSRSRTLIQVRKAQAGSGISD
ncbi:MAG: outer membrane lipoprotein-sorting protein [Verrucomicrobiota bacterium]